MALRIANKINRQFVKNISIRGLSGKREVELEPSVQKLEDVNRTPAEMSPPPPPVPAPSSSIKYEVCRPRKSPVMQFPNTVQNESDVVKQTVAMQHLQPSMLPEYYKPPIEINSACMGVDTITENTSQYRKFEESNTFKNITLPLKAPKLANPFPEPVKVMPSHTVSDDEKAEQMLAESKIIKNVPSSSGTSVRTSTIRAYPNSRSYSTQDTGGSGPNSKKCKLNKGKEAKKCQKIKVPHCTPVKSIRCGKRKKRAVQCVKKMSPYPSYSESCHEDPYNKPSECKICPYKPEEHPTFKPSKNDYHTSSSFANRGRYDRLRISTKARKNIKSQPRSFLSTTPKGPPKAAQDEKEAKKIEEFAKTRQALQSSTVSLSKEMGAWLNRLQPEDILLPPVARMHEMQVVDAKEGGGKCKKFPFKECTFTIVKHRKPREGIKGKCPEKEKRKLIKDCPRESEERCKKTAPELTQGPLTYKMCDKDGSNDNQKKKCPKVNVGVCKNEIDNRDDPCGRRKRGKTLICPNDLLKKGRGDKKKKKTSGVIPPLQQIPPATPKPETTVNM